MTATLSAADVFRRIRASGVLGIVRSGSGVAAHRSAGRILDAGLDVVEISLTTPGALAVIEEVAGAYADRVVGAGTVRTAKQAKAVVAAGARLIVCPIMVPEVIDAARQADVAVLAGCLTPTEMSTAMDLGATAVKIFPANLWSTRALSGLLQAMPDLPCVPTGGIGPDDAGDWITAGAAAVAIGAALTSAPDPELLVRTVLEGVSRARAADA